MELSCNKDKKLLTNHQFMCIVIGSIVEISVIFLPNEVVKIAHQDGYISVLIGAVYPLYIVLITAYMNKRFPNDNILTLSKRYFGKILGNILNLIFLTYFIYYLTSVTNYYVNLMRSFLVGFLTPLKVIGIVFFISLYTSLKGLKTLGRVSEIAFYVTLIVIVSSISALRVPNITNVKPILHSGFKYILQGALSTVYAYSGVEIILLIYPFNKDKDKILSSSIKSVIFVLIMYVWVVFITIYYLGPDIVNKGYWSFLLVTQSVTISAINNYRYIFIFLWSIVTFKSCSIYYYASTYILKDIIRRVSIKKFSFLIYPLFVYITFKLGNTVTTEEFSKYAAMAYTVFNLFYVTIIAICISFKKGGVN